MRLWSDCHLETCLYLEPIILPDSVLYSFGREGGGSLETGRLLHEHITEETSHDISDYKVL